MAIEFLFIALYFSINTYTSFQNQKVLSNEVMTSVQKTTYREAHEIDQTLQNIARLSLLMKNNHERFFREKIQCHTFKETAHFAVHNNGAYFKTQDNGGASLYYAAATKMGENEKRKALCSETLDMQLKDIVDINPLISQAYLNTHDDMNRLYPFMKDAPSQYGASINMQDYNFYFLADKQHNPEKGRVWTEAYLDPAGLGWMVSVIVPIYSNEFLEGVSGLDVTIDTIISSVLNLDLPWKSSAFLVDNEGVILAMPEKIEQLFSLNELTEHDYKQSVNSTVEKPTDFNIFNTPDLVLRKQFKDMFTLNHSLHQVEINNLPYVLSNSLIPETGWRLFVISDQESILLPIKSIKDHNQQIGYYALLAIVFFYIIFFFHISRKSRRVASEIATPIEQLSKQTSVIGKQLNVTLNADIGISEIDKLAENFNKMSQELDSRSSALVVEKVKKELVEQERKLFETMAVYDGLTRLYNRHKIDQVLEKELQRTVRYQRGLGILMIDIDFFKNINDLYGHAIGDKVLIKLSQVLLENLRESDYVGRWGGEEFLVICPEVDMSMLGAIAEKIRQSIQSNDFIKVGQITASFGGAVFQEGDNMESLFKRADSALYCAKSAGRNCYKFG